MDAPGLRILLLLGVAAAALTAPIEFLLINENKTWTEAQTYCREKHIDLVTIETEEDLVKVTQLGKDSGLQFVWTGHYDDVNSWRWSLDDSPLFTGSQINLGSWFDFRPDNDGSKEHCIYIYSGRFEDRKCDSAEKSVCYDESTNSFIPVEDVKSWHDARTFCRQNYRDLAAVKSQEALDKITEVARSGKWWVGLSRDSWKWSDQSEATFTKWASHEPDGGVNIYGCVRNEKMFDAAADEKLPFICSAYAPMKVTKVLKVTVKTTSSVNLNDPLVQEAILRKMEEDLRARGVHQQLSLSWRRGADGRAFNHTEL